MPKQQMFELDNIGEIWRKTQMVFDITSMLNVFFKIFRAKGDLCSKTTEVNETKRIKTSVLMTWEVGIYVCNFLPTLSMTRRHGKMYLTT